MKTVCIPASSGPGPEQRVEATRSSKRSHFIARSVSVASGDSNWKTPAVRPRRSSSYTAGSSNGSVSTSIRSPVRAAIISTASWMTVSVLRPSMSILSMPTFSSAAHLVLADDAVLAVRRGARALGRGRAHGDVVGSGPGAMTTPAACTEAWRDSPSIRDANWKTR
jgi:hypothetical protein